MLASLLPLRGLTDRLRVRRGLGGVLLLLLLEGHGSCCRFVQWILKDHCAVLIRGCAVIASSGSGATAISPGVPACTRGSASATTTTTTATDSITNATDTTTASGGALLCSCSEW